MECCDPSTTDNEHHENASRFEWLRHGLYDGFLFSQLLWKTSQPTGEQRSKPWNDIPLNPDWLIGIFILAYFSSLIYMGRKFHPLYNWQPTNGHRQQVDCATSNIVDSLLDAAIELLEVHEGLAWKSCMALAVEGRWMIALDERGWSYEDVNKNSVFFF